MPSVTQVSMLPPLLAAAVRPLPLAPLQVALALLLRGIVGRHPHIFERLGEHAGKRFGLSPTDLPFAFILSPAPPAPRIRAVRELPATGLDARIAGPLAGLLGMASGQFDGDALFFSRDLSVAGDIEAVVALRNAVDDAGLDLVAEAAALLGPLAPAAERAFHAAARLARHVGIGTEAAGGAWN